MKRNTLKLIVSFILLFIISCDEPETVVTNYVHTDGSVTRKIEMHSAKNQFKMSDLQISFDSTWAIKDTIKIGEKGDTTFIKSAEKLFKSIDDINLAYKNDSGVNKEVLRYASFKKTFRWFNTDYRFSETIGKNLAFGYPVSDFLNDDELMFFYSPDNVKYEKENGSDSLRFRILNDSVSHKVDHWTTKNLVSEWIGEFSKLIDKRSGNEITKESLKEHEDEFEKIVEANSAKFDSLWSNGILLQKLIGKDNALKYKIEADTAIEYVTRKLLLNFKDYSVRIVMPGKVIGTNGFIDSSEVLLWPVKSDYFLSENYEMWAESRIPNRWAWIVSGLFLVFVLTGIILRLIKKG
jgi:hypothetical protein